jgi:hypothetical protein
VSGGSASAAGGARFTVRLPISHETAPWVRPDATSPDAAPPYVN